MAAIDNLPNEIKEKIFDLVFHSRVGRKIWLLPTFMNYIMTRDKIVAPDTRLARQIVIVRPHQWSSQWHIQQFFNRFARTVENDPLLLVEVLPPRGQVCKVSRSGDAEHYEMAVAIAARIIPGQKLDLTPEQTAWLYPRLEPSPEKHARLAPMHGDELIILSRNAIPPQATRYHDSSFHLLDGVHATYISKVLSTAFNMLSVSHTWRTYADSYLRRHKFWLSRCLKVSNTTQLTLALSMPTFQYTYELEKLARGIDVLLVRVKLGNIELAKAAQRAAEREAANTRDAAVVELEDTEANETEGQSDAHATEDVHDVTLQNKGAQE